MDPLATGVLIVGIGKGTKYLQRFLECTKSYECVVLFGAASDSYDAVGKVVSRAPYEHVTKQLVEEKLKGFRGKIMQKPSIFSALKVDGKKMYEYARAGGEVPEVQARPVEVHELELVEWLEPGSHDLNWPKEEVDSVEKVGAEKLMGVRSKDDVVDKANEPHGIKRNREEDEDHVSTEESYPKKPRTNSEPAMSGALPIQESTSTDKPAKTSLANDKSERSVTLPMDDVQLQPEPTRTPRLNGEPAMSGALTIEDAQPREEPSVSIADSTKLEDFQSLESRSQPPAARLRMTVTSGFYVRSLCHDLGLACNSLGLMSSLIRSRQGDYELNKNVLEYSDLEAGPEIWEPKIKTYLEDFMEKEGWEAEEVEDGESWKANMNEREEERREADRDRSFQGSKKRVGERGNWKKGKGNWKKREGKTYYSKDMNGGRD